MADSFRVRKDGEPTMVGAGTKIVEYASVIVIFRILILLK